MTHLTQQPSVDKAWDRFVEQHPLSTVAHLSVWGRIFERAYGHEPIYLSAEDGGDLTGVLPLVRMRSRLFGHHLVSMPFLDYGGVVADPGSPAETALVKAATDLARRTGAQTVGLRQFHPMAAGPPAADDRVTMLLPLTTVEAAWKALPSERRNRVRKGEKSGLSAAWKGGEALDDFYPVLAENMRDLGSPVHSRRFFTVMFEELGDLARLVLVRDREGRAVGGAVVLTFRDTIIVPGWVSSLRSAFALCPNFVLYWDVIRFGCANGYRVFDLGRSFTHAGTFEFKRQWGAAPHPLPWRWLDTNPGRCPPVDRDRARLSPLVEGWKRLPLPVANLVGPWIRRQVPN
jgi:FemAB-related protein (PEP-CTERM system-associated)